MAKRPAALGGDPAFPEGLPLVRPTFADPKGLAAELQRILESGVITNGPRVRELERRTAEYLGVRHCVAVSSCTSGLMLVLRAMGVTGDAVLPSFTFVATAHAASWNGLRPRFADVDRSTLTLSPKSASRAISVRASVMVATHVYGTPCDVEALTEVAKTNGIGLVFDAAHAFGSRRAGVPVGGSGDAEVFSLSPTKVLVAAEGGIVATNDDVLAERCRIGRDEGNPPGDYDSRLVGLNARMSELHAAVALASLADLDERIECRNALAGAYRTALQELPGLSFPRLPEGDRSTYKDFTVLVEPEAFGVSADGLARALEAEGIETRRYYAPPVHRMRAYRWATAGNGHLPVTAWASERVITLPLWAGMSEEHVGRVAEALGRIRRFSHEE